MSRLPLRRARRASVVATLAAVLAALLPTPAHAAVPIGNLPGWTQVVHEDFNGALNTARWGLYDGPTDTYGMWSPKHLEMHGGQAWLHGYREGGNFVTAGMMEVTNPQLYGKYLVRARFDRGAGISHVLILWPTAETWPPEVDFSEGESRTRTMATSHWDANNDQTHLFVGVDLTQWHTYGVEWTPTRLTYTLDGHAWGSMTGLAVPHIPMNLAIQTQALRDVGPVSLATPRDVTYAVDWVSIYRYH